MLLLALLASGGIRLLASQLRQGAHPDLQIALYRYPADAMPECEQLLGPAAVPDNTVDAGTMWMRMQLSPLAEIASGACRRSVPVAM